MTDWRTLSERQILKALAEGKLSKLEGEGKPLPDRPGDAYADPATSAGYRIMAEAGALPEEFAIKAALEVAMDALKAAKGADRKPAMARVADLQMRLSIAQDARRRFMR